MSVFHGNSSVSFPRRPRAGSVFDPGWLYVIAGLGMLCAVLIVRAQEQTRVARHLRDQALAVERHRLDRIAKYEEFLGALDSQSPTLIEALAGSQLNQIPADRAAIPGTVRDYISDASVFPALEPPPLVLPEYRATTSALARIVRDERTRLIVLAGSMVVVLVGLLPGTRSRAG